MDKQTNKLTDEWTDERTNKQTNRLTLAFLELLSKLLNYLYKNTNRENHEFAPNLDDIASKFLRLILFEFASKSYQIRS